MEIEYAILAVVLCVIGVACWTLRNVFLALRKNPIRFLTTLALRLAQKRWSFGGALLSFLYVIWPADFVPDIILIFGWLDDLGALGIGAYLLKKVFTFTPLLPKKDDQKQLTPKG